MANKLNNFDQLIKDSFEGYEAPYNSAHWEALEEDLEIAAPNMVSYFGAVTTGLVAVSVVFLSMLFFFSDATSNGNTKNIEKTPIAQNENGTSDSNTLKNEALATTLSDAVDSVDVPATAKTKEPVQKSETPTSNTTANNQSAKSDKAVSNNQNVTASIEPSSTTKVRKGCTGLIINFDASEQYGEGAKYLWNFGDGYFSNEANPSHTFNKEGVFDVSLSVTSKKTGQISSNVIQAMIEVIEAPVAYLNVTIDNPKQVTLNNDSYNASSLEWIVDGKTVSNKSEINLSIADNTRYRIALNAMNEGGCSDTLTYEINSISAGNEFPKAMDQTSGHSFAPGTIVDNGEIISLKIFNKKTSTLVFDGVGSQGWTGTNILGNPAENGTYRWVMAVKKPGAVDVYKGDIVLR